MNLSLAYESYKSCHYPGMPRIPGKNRNSVMLCSVFVSNTTFIVLLQKIERGF
jgi:hypothetical protein